jgi:hypothetical protein
MEITHTPTYKHFSSQIDRYLAARTGSQYKIVLDLCSKLIAIRTNYFNLKLGEKK